MSKYSESLRFMRYSVSFHHHPLHSLRSFSGCHTVLALLIQWLPHINSFAHTMRQVWWQPLSERSE